MLDPIYHRTLKLLKDQFFLSENVKTLSSFTQSINGRHYVTLLNL